MTIKKELFKIANKIVGYSGYELNLKQLDKDKDEQFLFIDYVKSSKKNYSQIYQDLFVQYILKEKTNGFFVEFGATNGLKLSNTFLLESDYGWKGILAEPATCWHSDLFKNRKCIIDKQCVWNKSGEIFSFEEDSQEPELSTLNQYASTYKNTKKSLNVYNVQTISLNDLLTSHNAPTDIDYMSVDTEGSEYDILKSLDFNKWNIKIITVEHNFQLEKRNKINLLLKKHGYERKFLQLSRWDDWYVKAI